MSLPAAHSVFDLALAEGRRLLARFTLRLEPVPESPCSMALAVYGVPVAQVSAVRSTLHDLAWRLVVPKGLVLLPMVVNEYNTREYYPELVPVPR